MTITITFDDDHEAKQAIHASAAWACLYDVVYHKIRNHLKHDTPLTMEELRDYIHENPELLEASDEQ